MKNQFSIIMFGLLGLCALATILLIVVIVITGGKFKPSKLFARQGSQQGALVQPDNSEASSDQIIIPDRFKDPVDSTAVIADTADTTTTAEEPDETPAVSQKFFCKVSCGQTITPLHLKEILTSGDLFCATSQWSRGWANPKGKGLRTSREGLLFADSTVLDSFTNTMWQRYSSRRAFVYSRADSLVTALNNHTWQGYDNWRLPTIEELMTLMLPAKNRSGLHFPGGWNNGTLDLWSCSIATDSLSVKWRWVVRTGLGRCNIGHPDTARSLIAVRSLR